MNVKNLTTAIISNYVYKNCSKYAQRSNHPQNYDELQFS